jgi:ATP-dependent DNA helicase
MLAERSISESRLTVLIRKTIQVISLIAHLRTMKVTGPFMIVAPLATLPNWVREFEKWLPGHPVVRFHGSAKDRDAMIDGPLNAKFRKNDDFPIVVTSYEVAIRDEKRLNKIGEYTYLVVDEGQRLKNHRCTLISSLKRIRCSNRLLLSGTPIQNNLDELWSLLNFVNPSIFDDLNIFQSWFGFRNIGQKTQGATTEEDILAEERKHQTVSKLHEILRPFLLRRIKTDVLDDLPPKKEIIVYAGMSKLQDGYSKMIDQGILRDVLLNQGIEAARALSQTNKQMNHRKNCNHPFMFGEPIDPATGAHMGSAHPQLLIRASGKFALLDRMLERLYRDKHQVLIFSQMTSLLNVIEDYLLYRQWKYCRIDGSTNIDERQRQMDVFNSEKTAGQGGKRNDGDDRHFVFMLSTRAGGVGINLATADTCIIFDSDWNPHQDSQAMDRCHRIGQNRPVAVYRLLTVNSVDIEMMEKQISKKKLERMAIVGGDFRKAGSRSMGEFKTESLNELLNDDVKDLQSKGMDADTIRIDDEEFEYIMNREKLFSDGEGAIPTEGKMYDVIDAHKGDVLGAMT